MTSETTPVTLDYDNIEIRRVRRKTKAIINALGIQAKGTATCNRTDKYSEEIGESIAIARALVSLGIQLEKDWILRATPLQDWKKTHPKKELPRLP